MYNMNKCFEFISIIEAYGLMNLRFNGQTFTWCIQRVVVARVWKRLDKAIVKDRWLATISETTIDHLPTISSDHTNFYGNDP